MKVRDVMTKNVISVKAEDRILDVLNLLFKMKMSGFPVIDAQGRLAGMVTEKNILSYILPSYIGTVGRFIYEENPKSTKKKFAELSGMSVGQFMRSDVISTTGDITLCEVARIMLTQKIRRIPVIDDSGMLIGIIARGDILQSMAREMDKTGGCP